MRIAVVSDTTMPTPTAGGHGLGRVTSIVAEGLLARGHDVVMFAKAGSTFSGALVTLDAHGYDGERALASEVVKAHHAMMFDCIIDNGHIHYLSQMLPDLSVINVYHDQYQPHARCAVLLSEGQRALMPPEFSNAVIIRNSLNPTDYLPNYDHTDPPYALYMGAISDIKQPLLAIEACAQFGVKLIMAGPELTGKLPITPASNVEYVGVVNGNYKANLYACARVFLQLGVGESFGLTTLESALHGTPVVGWPIGGTLDLIRNGVNGAFVGLLGSDKVQNVVDAMARAWWIRRDACRAYTETLCDNDKQITIYEQVCSAVTRGAVW